MRIVQSFTAMLVMGAAVALGGASSSAANIVELWGQAKAPPPPKLSNVRVKAATTAFLVLDIEKLTCNTKRRPRCVDSVAGMASFLKKARASGMTVAYSNTGRGSRETILPPVTPRDNEPIVKASVNKFYGTDLDKYLKSKKVNTVIICGTAAFGAVLHTATGAAARRYKVILPVDCAPGGSLYEEQMAVWGLVNGPGTRRALTATTLSGITIE